ncbi:MULTISPECIES: ECF transporter S component [Clostridium]|uniref:ECF transporter S component n=1 Tax=Clostridium TaxID=1485 RepID=UPI00069E1A2B|nr:MULTISPECIES: ECF transporter S component [Clostridium]KOF57065.1 membrane protein [Clostridium sp. DMHC 10]MCD2348072.1 ECF transporter S component [Clostridium guangxiense]
MNKNVLAKSKFETRQLTIVGLLSAISVTLGLTGYGFIPFPIAHATIMHIPVIIGAIIEGPVVGILVGLMFGVFSMIQNMMTPSVLSFAFMNPLVAILPRVLIGVTAYYTYALLKKCNEPLRIGITAVVGTLTNTVGVLTMIYFLYAERYAQAAKISVSGAAKAIYGVAGLNGSIESAVAVVIIVPVVLAIKKIRGRS